MHVVPHLSSSLAPETPKSQRHPVARWTQLALVLVGWIACLLAFPSVVHWIMLAWLMIAGWVAARGELRKSGWGLLGLAVVLVSKTPESSWIWWCLPAALMLAGIGLIWRFRLDRITVFLVVISLLACSYWFVVRLFDEHRGQSYVLEGRPVHLLGDSLTDYGYPEVLASQLRLRTVDCGQNGLTLEAAIKDWLPQIEADPGLVVVELGGHDFKDGRPRDAIRADLVTLIERIRAAKGEVLLMEIPRGFISDPLYGLERELAREYGLQLIPDSIIRRLIYFSPIIPPGQWLPPDRRLSNDGLHPNDNGNRAMAVVVREALVRRLGPEILK